MSSNLIRYGLATVAIAAASLTSGFAQASQVVNIPYSQALALGSNGECTPYVPFNGTPNGFFAGSTFCQLEFPLTVPVGHSVQQIAILHSTDTYVPNQHVYAEVEVVQMGTADYQSMFFWSSFDSVPHGTVDIHKLMQETSTPHGLAYPDAFTIEANSFYNVTVQFQDEAIEGIQVTYN